MKVQTERKKGQAVSDLRKTQLHKCAENIKPPSNSSVEYYIPS